MKQIPTFKFTTSQVRITPMPGKSQIFNDVEATDRIVDLKASNARAKPAKRNNNFQAVAENIPDVICRYDREFRLLYVNPAIEKATGVPRHMFIGKNPLDVGMPEDFVNFWNKHVQKVFLTKKQASLEFVFPTPAGEKYFQSILVPEFDIDGTVYTVLTISRDITKLKKLEKQKDDFLDMASHELKTPLTVLKAFTRLLENRLTKPRDKRHMYFVKNINLQTERITSLVNDLLNVGRIDSGMLTFKKKSFDLDKLVKKVAVYFQYSVETHAIKLEGEVAENVLGDEDRIEQILVNLITNAVKYSPDADKVVLRLKKDKEFAHIIVEDFGYGISKTDQARLFERFYRTDDKKKQRISGFGLGLYIAKEFVSRHGGKIWLESVEGKGSLFHFTLPLSRR